MSRAHRIGRTALAVALAAAAFAPTAWANAYTDVLHAYQHSHTGTIPPCQFSPGTLAAALREVNTYDAQYFQDFTNAVQTALSEQAGGACSRSSPPVRAGGGGPAPAIPAGPVPATSSAAPPSPLVALAALVAVIGAALGVGALARSRGWDPVWAQAWRHAWAEAGYRAAGAWAEIGDWLRSGRYS